MVIYQDQTIKCHCTIRTLTLPLKPVITTLIISTTSTILPSPILRIFITKALIRVAPLLHPGTCPSSLRITWILIRPVLCSPSIWVWAVLVEQCIRMPIVIFRIIKYEVDLLPAAVSVAVVLVVAPIPALKVNTNHPSTKYIPRLLHPQWICSQPTNGCKLSEMFQKPIVSISQFKTHFKNFNNTLFIETQI